MATPTLTSHLQQQQPSPKKPLTTLYNFNLQPQSPFLRLPPELRNKIYKLLLTEPRARALRSHSSRGHLSSYVLPSLDLHPAILSTCKQIHAEATPILYNHTFGAHNTLLTKLPFLVDSFKPVVCPPVDADGRSMIRKWHMVVRLDTDPRFKARQAKECFTGVDELEIEVWQAMFGADGGYGVLKRFDGIRGVKNAKVSGHVDPDLANWLERTMMQPFGAPAAELPAGKGWEREDDDDGAWMWGSR